MSWRPGVRGPIWMVCVWGSRRSCLKFKLTPPSLVLWGVSSHCQDNRATSALLLWLFWAAVWSPSLPPAPASALLLGVAGWGEASPIRESCGGDPWSGWRAGAQPLPPYQRWKSAAGTLPQVARHGGSHSAGGGLGTHAEGERSQPSGCWRAPDFTSTGGQQPHSPAPGPSRRWLRGLGRVGRPSGGSWEATTTPWNHLLRFVQSCMASWDQALGWRSIGWSSHPLPWWVFTCYRGSLLGFQPRIQWMLFVALYSD